MAFDQYRTPIDFGIARPSGRDPPICHVRESRALSSVRPNRIIDFTIHVVRSLGDGHGKGYALVFECPLIRSGERHRHTGFPLQIGVLASAGERVEDELQRVSGSDADAYCVRGASRFGGRDHRKLVASHILEDITLGECSRHVQLEHPLALLVPGDRTGLAEVSMERQFSDTLESARGEILISGRTRSSDIAMGQRIAVTESCRLESDRARREVLGKRPLLPAAGSPRQPISKD